MADQKIIDPKLPITWIIGGLFSFAIFGAGLTWTAASNSKNIENKVDQLLVSIAKLEKRVDEKDVRVETVRDNMFSMQRQIDSNERRILHLEGGRK